LARGGREKSTNDKADRQDHGVVPRSVFCRSFQSRGH
jgi:hypothetical protein